MKDETGNHKQAAGSVERVAYTKPELKVFGPVGALTQAGSFNGSEMMPGAVGDPAYMR
jgi:hypothetical protein